MAKKYTGSFADYEKKLKTVMERIGIGKYNYDWNRTGCFVEFLCKGRVFRFEHNLDSDYAKREKLIHVSDLFAQVVLTLEDLARASDRGLYDFSQIISGLPSLPEGVASLVPCFIAMGFSTMPQTKQDITNQYHRQAKVMHPDQGGDRDAFEILQSNYKKCLDQFQQKNK